MCPFSSFKSTVGGAQERRDVQRSFSVVRHVDERPSEGGDLYLKRWRPVLEDGELLRARGQLMATKDFQGKVVIVTGAAGGRGAVPQGHGVGRKRQHSEGVGHVPAAGIGLALHVINLALKLRSRGEHCI